MQKHKVELDGLKNPCSGGGDGGLWYCSIGLFSCSISVSSSSAVCSFSSFWMTVISEIRLFTVLWYRLFAHGHHLLCGNFLSRGERRRTLSQQE